MTIKASSMYSRTRTKAPHLLSGCRSFWHRRQSFKGITPEAENFLATLTWPGNVRQLENAIERVVLIHDGPYIEVGHLRFLEPYLPLKNSRHEGIANGPVSGRYFTLPKEGVDLDELINQRQKVYYRHDLQDEQDENKMKRDELCFSRYELKEKDYRQLAKIVYDCAGINLGDNKQELVQARLGKILRKRNISGFEEYIKLLGADTSGDELTVLLNAMATNVTHFFRESEHFDFIAQQYSELRNLGELRFWSAGCSSGEEPYTIAITLCELFGNCSPSKPYILATDISTRVLEKAKQGEYSIKAIDTLELSLLKKYFLKGKGSADGLVRVRKEITGMVIFQHRNSS